MACRPTRRLRFWRRTPTLCSSVRSYTNVPMCVQDSKIAPPRGEGLLHPSCSIHRQTALHTGWPCLSLYWSWPAFLVRFLTCSNRAFPFSLSFALPFCPLPSFLTCTLTQLCRFVSHLLPTFSSFFFLRCAPQLLPSLMQQLAAQNPQLVQLINENQEDFYHLINAPPGPMPGGAPGGAPGGGAGVQVTPEENEDIERLAALGFDRTMAVQVCCDCVTMCWGDDVMG